MSILIAAEWGIYGRFGYGASTDQPWTVDALAAEIRHHPQGTVEYVDRDAARALAPEVYERHRSKRPGEISRPDYFWDIDFGILRYPSWSESKPTFYAIARDPAGLVTGVARYRYQDKWEHRQPKGQVNVGLFLTSDPAAEALLWHHLLTLDLTASVRRDARLDLPGWLRCANPRGRGTDRRTLDQRGGEGRWHVSLPRHTVVHHLVLNAATASGGQSQANGVDVPAG